MSKLTPQLVDVLIDKFHELESNPDGAFHQVMAAVMSAGSKNDDLTAWVRRLLPVDAEHADAHEHGVQMLDRGCQQPGAGLDQCVVPDSAVNSVMRGKATLSPSDPNTPETDDGTSVLSEVREFVATHHDVSKLVREAQKFSINLPIIGKVSVPHPGNSPSAG